MGWWCMFRQDKPASACEEAMIEIHHIFPSRSLRVLWLLEEINVPYTLRPLRWPVREHNPEYLEISPAGTFPAATESGETWLESMAICELLALRHGGEALIVTSDNPGYARYLQWLWFGEATLTPQLANIMRYGAHMPESMQMPRAVGDATEAFSSRLDALEKRFPDGEFIAGKSFSLADISIGYGLFLGCEVLGQGERFGPIVRAYWTMLSSRPAFRAALRKATPSP